MGDRTTAVDRRNFLQISGIAIAGTGAFSSARGTEAGYLQTEEPNESSSDWPMFRGDARNTGRNQHVTEPGDLKKQWSFETNGVVYSSPTVADGVVYLGSTDGYIYAVNADTGKERWRFNVGGVIHSSIAISADTVYVGSRNHTIYALNTTNGSARRRWHFKTGGPISSSPTIADGTVYIGSDDGALYALNRHTGTERWRFETEDAIFSSPAVSSNTVYIGSYDSTLYALNADDGSVEWRFKTDGPIGSSPAVADETVFIGSSDGRIYALTAAEGKERWRFDTGSRITASPAVAHGLVYVGSWKNGLYALDRNQLRTDKVDAANNAQIWHLNRYKGMSSPAATEDRIYVGSDDNSIYALHPERRAISERFETQDKIRSSPAVVDDTVYVGSYDGKLYALAEDDDSNSLPPVEEPWYSGLIGSTIGAITGFLLGNIEDNHSTRLIIEKVFILLLGIIGISGAIGRDYVNPLPTTIGLTVGLIALAMVGISLRKKGYSISPTGN